jgi:hypothetical protein
VEEAVRRIVEMFSKRKGHTLIDVWTQGGSVTLLPSEKDRPPVSEEKRIMLDFRGPDGRLSSVRIHVAAQEDGPNIIHVSEQND